MILSKSGHLKRFLLVLVICIIIVGIGFGLYIYKLHTLAVEGNNLYGLRCTDVNPSLIAYKNSFLNMAAEMNKGADSDADALVQAFDDYNAGISEYVANEDEWLAKNDIYINRWDFQLFMPWYMKEAAALQAGMHTGYRDDAYYLGQIVAQEGIDEELNAQLDEARERRNTYENQYVELLDEMATMNDWRLSIIEQPLPEGCTEENTTIPDTTGSINW